MRQMKWLCTGILIRVRKESILKKIIQLTSIAHVMFFSIARMVALLPRVRSTYMPTTGSNCNSMLSALLGVTR